MSDDSTLTTAAATEPARPETAAPATVYMPLHVSAMGAEAWASFKAWLRREMALHASGVSPDEREAMNP